ncbi:cyclin-dependent kinase 7-like [Corticium candelabrum]|uniref:cyclin-dependent kinase 7-like n=1 Tax=Corticium candelabrum TaxID=121492 RepID=UPI002E260F8A|nr:cyclin-dependent kinase 7-like [Corticium candelabrum]
MYEDRSANYRKIEFLGEGQFATVFKAEDLAHDGRIVAVKKIKMGRRQEASDGINRTALREIKLLQELSHPHIIGLLDVFGHNSNISLVFDFMNTDLEVIIKDTSIVLTAGNIKRYLLMTLQGLEYLHSMWVLHRDMKPNNLLVDKNGILKITDFGLAKFYGSPNRVYTHQVVTRWYRCPELLFGARIYGPGVDTWATGCILAELLLRVPFLTGESDLDQLSKIFETLGTPSDDDWPGMTKLPDYIPFKSFPGVPFKLIFKAASNDLLELLAGLLTHCPSKRLMSTQALKSGWFSNKPPPTPCHLLPQPKSKEEQQRIEAEQLEEKRKRRTEKMQSAGLPKRLKFN